VSALLASCSGEEAHLAARRRGVLVRPWPVVLPREAYLSAQALASAVAPSLEAHLFWKSGPAGGRAAHPATMMSAEVPVHMPGSFLAELVVYSQ
jgi:hypothetical protein